jgi:YidC/Oxa1 family membrane protein insertase
VLAVLAASILSPLEEVVSQFIVLVHSGLAHLAGSHQGWAWAVAIVALVAVIRILLFPLFAKQSRSMRQMQLLQPKVKEIQRKYADDKQTQQQELMKLYRETGVNPLGGCLPLIVQGPIFFALYRVLYNVRPPFTHVTGMTQGQAKDFGLSTLFGTPIAAAFNSSKHYLDVLSRAPYNAAVGSPTTVKIVTGIFIVAMSAATFVTTRQSMARTVAAQASSGQDNPLMRQQKIIMYVMPLFLLVFGYRVPLGALIYWLSNNVFTMIQQHFLYRRMDAEAAAAAAAPATVAPAAVAPKAPAGSGSGTTKAPAPDSSPVQRPWQSGPARRPPANRSKSKRSRRR